MNPHPLTHTHTKHTKHTKHTSTYIYTLDSHALLSWFWCWFFVSFFGGNTDRYADFLSYKGGIYKHVSGEYVGGHAVKVSYHPLTLNQHMHTPPSLSVLFCSVLSTLFMNQT
jgi:hypothetical protein